MHHQTLSDPPGVPTVDGALVRAALAADTFEFMANQVLDGLPKWAQAPDLYAMAWSGDFSGSHSDAGLQQRAAVSWALEINPKPALSWLDGPVGDAGAAFALFGTHRVGTYGVGTQRVGTMPDGVPMDSSSSAEHRGFAMAFDGALRAAFPAPGVAWFLARRARRGVAQALLLTGDTVDAPTALHLGILTHVLSAETLPGIVAGLVDAHPIDPLLDTARAAEGPNGSAVPMPGSIPPSWLLSADVLSAFGQGKLELIRQALSALPQARWAGDPAGEVVRRVAALPDDFATALLALIDRSATVDLDMALKLDWRLRHHWARGARPDGGATAHLFAPLGALELVLPPRPRTIIAAV